MARSGLEWSISSPGGVPEPVSSIRPPTPSMPLRDRPIWGWALVGHFVGSQRVPTVDGGFGRGGGRRLVLRRDHHGIAAAPYSLPTTGIPPPATGDYGS